MPDRSFLKRVLLPLIGALVVLVILFAVVTWLPLRTARTAWREGRIAESVGQAQSWSRARMWPNQYHQMLAAAFLSVGNRPAAKEHLDAIRGKRLIISALPKAEVAQRLFARGRYDDYLAYDEAARTLFRSDDAPLYRAAALTATNRIAEAEAAIGGIGSADPKKLAALQAAIAQRRQGSYPWVIDRQGKTIASYQIANGDVVTVNRDFDALVEKSAGRLTLGAHAQQLGVDDTIETTLDPDVQRAALTALGGFRGALVAIDPKTNEILAIASNRGRGPLANLALEQQYEPGSVIKVLTGMNALASGIDVKSMFPYQCNGELIIDGRHFGDWLPGGHGLLPDLDEALAESCNVVFADLGVRLGADKLKAFMQAAGFDGQTDLGLFKVPLGVTVGPMFNKFETAFYAIGLEHETTTALHLAMIASTMANRGVMTAPRLFVARRSILGDEVGAPPKQGAVRIAPADVAQRIVQCMVAVATREKGTGKRAPVEGLPLALKTGTAGKREAGFNAQIVAFAPVDQPKIAFAVIAEDSGPAEFAGAKIAHDFLEGIKGRLK